MQLVQNGYDPHALVPDHAAAKMRKISALFHRIISYRITSVFCYDILLHISTYNLLLHHITSEFCFFPQAQDEGDKGPFSEKIG